MHLYADCNQFVYLYLSPEKSVGRFDIDTKVRCQIRRVIVSPNDLITVFVLEDPRHGYNKSRVAIYRTKDLLGGSSSR